MRRAESRLGSVTGGNVSIYAVRRSDYVEVDHHKMTAKLTRIPLLNEIPFPVMMEPHLVVEYYSR